MKVNSKLSTVTGVGEQLTKKLAVLGLVSVGDLIEFLPRRYEDYSHLSSIALMKPGPVTIEATIKQIKGRYARRGLHITEAVASDSSGSVRLVWFNQPYLVGSLRVGSAYYISGQFGLNYQRLSIQNPSVELVSSFPVNTARILPIYRQTAGLTSKQIRRIIKEVAPVITMEPETLPNWLIKSEKLLDRSRALMAMHFPTSQSELASAQRRLGFEEVFCLSLAGLLNKQSNVKSVGVAVPFRLELAQQFVRQLPFSLTDDQRRVIWQIYQDMVRPQPMNRLVEGDVGSGKTVVAAMAALMALAQGYQVAMMMPTELLARQHAETIHRLLQGLGMAELVGLLVGSLKPTEKQRMHAAIADGQCRFLIGTQALIQDKVNMAKLALVIVDEQHRFGVEQRQKLAAKAGHLPHILTLTATPIPRSLALTLYGELEISKLVEMPPGRKPVITKISSPNSRSEVYKRISSELTAGRQLFVVCPTITESSEVKSVERVYEDLSKGYFGQWQIGLLHGKMTVAEKAKTMERFVEGKLNILVSTTVIEVGVDVPNATVMLIESCERFGLAQMHQLRGRVGRGQHQGYCFLMPSDSRPPAARLRALEQSTNGFELAELDLNIRGPGALYGESQHGALDLRVAKLNDAKLIASAAQAAALFIEREKEMLQYTELMARVNALRSVTTLN